MPHLYLLASVMGIMVLNNIEMAMNMITIKQYIIEKNNIGMAVNMITIKQ